MDASLTIWFNNTEIIVTDNARFVPGLDLSRAMARELEPRLRGAFHGLPIALAFVGPGSDVMGFDTQRSMDHDWGPRVALIVPDGQVDTIRQEFNEQIDQLLPFEIGGFPTRVSSHPDGTALMDANGTSHRVRITSVEELLRTMLLIDSMDELCDAVWLSTPMQTLIELTAGEVFLDDTGELMDMRERLAFYPEHIWRCQLAGLWMRISQVHPFIGRTSEVGDEAGSAVVTAGIVRDLMRIALLQSRRYAPYAKWLGSACQQTIVGAKIMPALMVALTGHDWRTRESGTISAGLELLDHLNRLSLVDAIPA